MSAYADRHIFLFKRIARNILATPAILFLRRLFSDKTLGLGPIEHDVLKSMRISNRSIYADRLHELCKFWKIPGVMVIASFFLRGWPFSERFHASLYAEFKDHTVPGKLKKAYEDAAFLYSSILMLSMHRGEWLIPFLGDIQNYMPDFSVRVLEYGCGVSDMGLLLAGRGYEITIADLEDRKLDFTRWRYSERGLSCVAISVVDTEIFPELESNAFDLIVVSEVLEHVRNPLELLTMLTAALKTNGLFFCTTGSSIERNVEGDHLAEAVAIGQSPEYREYFERNYKALQERSGLKFLFQKRCA